MGKPVEKKRKKKGRPSLLDLQRRSLRLQKQQQQQDQQGDQQQQQQQKAKRNPNPSPNPYLRFPPDATPSRRAARRNRSPEVGGEDAEEEEEEARGKRREKKLKLVLRLQQSDGDARSGGSHRDLSGSDACGSESDGEGGGSLKKRRIDAIGGDVPGQEKTERNNHASKATDPLQVGPSDSGSTTPLPDEKLLLFVLDRLQKKDTYGVFSEPVDPDELPDYREVVEHPMDFSTVRKRLSSGYYANLEMFEETLVLYRKRHHTDYRLWKWWHLETLSARAKLDLAESENFQLYDVIEAARAGYWSKPHYIVELKDHVKPVVVEQDWSYQIDGCDRTYMHSFRLMDTDRMKDVFLICSNAMRYNAPDTIYFRQARSIQELANKNFENLRQESSEDDEPEPKVARRGRPPSKNMAKKAVGRPPTDRASSDFSSGATLANAGDNTLWSNSSRDLTRKGFSLDKLGSADPSARVNHGMRNSESYNWIAEKSDRNEESGSMKGILMRSGKKVFVLDENRRSTYRQSPLSTCWHESSVLSAFDGEKRLLVPIGIHIEHAYARSLARFAANLGPIGWDIAAKQIEKVLPPGTKFGHGWVGDSHVTQQYQPPLQSASPPRPLSRPATALPKADVVTERLGSPSIGVAVEGGHSVQMTTSASSAISSRSSNPTGGAESARLLNSESSFGTASGSNDGGIVGMQPKTPFQLHQKMTIHPAVNGLSSNTSFGSDLSQVGKMARPARLTANFVSEVPMTHSRVLDIVSRGDNSFSYPGNASHVETGRLKPGNSGAVCVSSLPDSYLDLHGSWRGLSLKPKLDSASPPDLNIRFQSAGSPPSGVMVDSQQPDLALQL